ncbi:MAG: hypothetical protein WBC73_14085 [Phormidesmis sp.]
MQQGQILTTVVVVIAIEVMNLNKRIWQKVESTMFTSAILRAK